MSSDWGWASEATPAAKLFDKATTGVDNLGGRAASTAGRVAGAPFRLAAKPFTAAGGAAAKGAWGAAKWGGRALIGAAARAPLATGLGVASMGLVPMSMSQGPSPSQQAASAAMQRQSQHFMKAGHVQIVSDEDIRVHNKVRAGLEKQASLRGIARVTQDQLDDALQKAIKAGKKSAKGTPKENTYRIGGERGYRLQDVALAGLALGGASAIAGLGGQALGAGVGELGELKHRMGRSRHFNAMVKADPELRQYSHDEVQKVFGVIHRASPYVAKEPLLAASTVRSIMDTPRATHGSRTPVVSPEAITRVLDMESGRQGTKYPYMQESRGRPEGDLRGVTDLIG